MRVHKWQEDFTTVQCYILASTYSELQRQHEDMESRSMLPHLLKLFSEQSITQRYEILKSLFRSQMDELSSVHAHVLKMIELIERLAVFGVELLIEMSTNIILQFLLDSFS